MKTRFTLLAAASITAIFTLVSCDKADMTYNDARQQTDGARVIAVSFSGNSTKTVLDGLQPKFVAGDVIKVANGTGTPEDCTVRIDSDGKATITTTLTGVLKAVYPATAAKMNAENDKAIDGILVPTEQDGTFASANICMAEIAETATEATFVNQTAVFKLYVPEKDDEKGLDYVAKSVAIKSIGVNNIADDSKEITVGDGTASVADADGYCYVALLPGEKFKNIDAFAGAGARTLSGEEAISTNNLYSVALPVINGHEYVEIGGKKWATMNVGATTIAGSPNTCFGDYFAWGETEPYYSEKAIIETDDPGNPYYADFTFKETLNDKTKGYDWANYSHCNGTENTLKKYCFNSDYGTVDSRTVLDSEDDAATANWGSSWRMPTTGEMIQSLFIKCNGGDDSPKNLTSSHLFRGAFYLPATQTYLPEYTGVDGFLFVDEDINKRMFIPTAGYVEGTSFNYHDEDCDFWSSSLYNVTPNYASYANIHIRLSMNSVEYRSIGIPVRPLAE